MLNSPKRSIRQKNKRLAKLDLKNDADTNPSPVSADFRSYFYQFYKTIFLNTWLL